MLEYLNFTLKKLKSVNKIILLCPDGTVVLHSLGVYYQNARSFEAPRFESWSGRSDKIIRYINNIYIFRILDFNNERRLKWKKTR